MLYCVHMLKTVESVLARITPEDEVNWEVVKGVVEGFTERYPHEVAGCVEYVKKLRTQTKDAYGLVTEKDGSNRRHVYEIPSRLHKALSTKYPKVFDDKNLRHFLKLYPIFQIPEKL